MTAFFKDTPISSAVVTHLSQFETVQRDDDIAENHFLEYLFENVQRTLDDLADVPHYLLKTPKRFVQEENSIFVNKYHYETEYLAGLYMLKNSVSNDSVTN